VDHGDRNRLLSRPGAAALGAWLGASIGLVAIALAVRSGQAWVDSLPQRDTDMFGRPEGWLLALALVVGAPPTLLGQPPLAL